MTPGEPLMQLWCVNSWDTLINMLWPFTMLTLVPVLDQSSLTILTAMAVKITSLIVHTVPFSTATGVTQMMLA